MKVLQINSVCGIGSTGRIASDLHNMLIEQGHESYIAYGREKPKNCNKTIKIGNKIDIFFHVLITRLFDRHGFGSKIATRKFIKKVRKINPDIIHLHNIHGYYINIKILFDYLKDSHKPVVWTLHDCWALTGHCAHFDFIGCEKWKVGCSLCPQVGAYPKSIILDNSKKNYTLKKTFFSVIENLTIVTPSEWLFNIVGRSFLKDITRKIINNGVDSSVFLKKNTAVKDEFSQKNPFIILGIANQWNEKKGLYDFIKMSKKLESDEIIMLVGIQKKLFKSLPKNIIPIEKTYIIENLVDIYNSADVFVNPTYEEVFGLTNLEALACGLPVITYNSGGSPDCIDVNSGFVIDKGDVDTMLTKIRYIKSNKVFSKENCRKRALLFEKNDKYKEYFDLYQVINY